MYCRIYYIFLPLLNILLQLQGAHTEKKKKNLSFHNFPRIMHKWCCVAYLQLYLLEISESGQKILSSQEVLKEEFSKYLSSAQAWQSWRPLKTRWQIWASIIISCHSWMRFNLPCDVMLMHLFHAYITFLFPEHMLPNRFWTGLSMMPEGWARRKAKFFRQSDCPSSPPYSLPKIQFCGKTAIWSLLMR